MLLGLTTLYSKQKVLERTNTTTFCTLFNNAVINFNHLVQTLGRGPGKIVKTNPGLP
jgi:hypothetical protein